MTNTSTPSACDWAYSLSEEPLLKFILVTKIMVSTAGLLATAYLIGKKGVRWLGHPNAKFIYILHIVFTALIAFGSLCIYAFDLIRLSSSSRDPCSFAISQGAAFHTRVLPVACISAQVFSMLCFAIERAISTIKPIAYEKITKPYLGYAMGLFFCTFGCFSQYAMLLPGIDTDSLTGVYAVRTEENSERYKLDVYIHLVIQCVTISLFWLVLKRNNLVLEMDFRTKQLRLCNKYQVTQNQRLIRLLLPCFVLHFLITTFCLFGISLYPLIIGPWGAVKHTLWVEAFAQFHVYSLLMPFVLLHRMRTVQHTVEVDRTPEIDEYFDSLRLLFDK